MKAMDGERYERAIEVFLRAREAPEADREKLLREACAGDADLLRSARALLNEDSRAWDPFDRAASGVADLLTEVGDGELPIPEKIGSFRIVGRIGEGGMGIVYEAEQESPRRSVALKVVRPGMATPRNLRRFELESDVLGRLEHPGIARIYEAGMADTPWGRVPFFAMERVRGRSLTEHCAERALGRRERVELLARVCEAVEHAHGKGVVHRDLKASNVLVAEDGTPKVLDFGVARLVERGADVVTELTMEGQIVGTLGTMSPEQVRGDSHAIDARTDVYALGSIGYELLAGRPPLEVAGRPLAEAARIVLEVDPAPLSSIEPGCRGDLDVIFATALEKDATHRYASASALAADLRRHLRDEPILARSPGAATLIRKFARRNRALVVGATAVFAALAIGGGVATWKAIEAVRSERDTLRQAYRANLAAATAALRMHDVGEATQRLDAAPPDLRGWEWRHLRSRVDESLAVFKIGNAPVIAVDVSPDGRLLAASTADGRLELWSPDTGDRVSSPSSPDARLDSLRFTSGGSRLLATREFPDRVIGFELDVPSLATRSSWESPMKGAYGTSFSADGSRYARSVFKSLFVLDTANGSRVAAWDFKNEFEITARFSLDGRRLAIASNGGFEVREIQDGAVLFTRRDVGGANTASFSPDGTKLVVGFQAPEARLCDAATGADIHVLGGHGAAVTDVAFSPDGALVATASADGALRLWDARVGALRRALRGHTGRIRRVVFTPDGRRLVTAGEDGTVRFWSAFDAGEPYELAYGEKAINVYKAVFSPDGRRLATGSLFEGVPSLRVWDVASGAPIAAWLDRHVTSLAWSPDGSRIAVGGHNFVTQQFDAATGAVLASFHGHDYNTDSVAYDPTSRRLLTAGLDGTVRLHDAATGKMLATYTVGTSQWEASPIYKAIYSPDGKWIAASRQSGAIEILDPESLQVRASVPGNLDRVTALAISRDGGSLATGTMHGEIAVWRTGSWELVARFRGHVGEVFAFAFTPDGSRLLSSGRDRVIRVWDTERWDAVTQLAGHTMYVYSLAFSPDGETLASASGDGTARLWGVRTRAERYQLQRERARRLDEVMPEVDAAFAAAPDAAGAVKRLRAHAWPDAESVEVAMQAAFGRAVTSRPAPR